MKLKVIYTGLIFLVVIKLHSQTIRYCECKNADTFNVSKFPFKETSIHVLEDSINFNIKIINTSFDTVYLFSSYFGNFFYGSEYIHRVDKKNKIIKVSFTPLIPYLFTKYSDVIQADNAIVSHNQVVYDFIKMQPGSQYVFQIPKFILLNKRIGVDDFDIYSLNKFMTNFHFRKTKISKRKIKKYKMVVEVALYKNVSFLCFESNYYLKELEFDKETKLFYIISSPIIDKVSD